jgi:hypothetical protein
MPNLNLNDDGSEETPMESLPPESELDFDESPSVIRRVLPYIASGILALLVAGFILNRTGIIHLWGTKKSVSAVVTVPTEPESQTLSDSAMMEQFRIDSAQIATGSTPVQSATPAPQKKEKETKAQQLAEQKKKEKETKAQQLAEQKKKEKETKAQQLAEQKKKAEDAKAARLAEQKKKAEAAQAQKLAEQKKQADAAEAKKQAAEKKQPNSPKRRSRLSKRKRPLPPRRKSKAS